MTSLQPGGKNLSSETIPAWDGSSRNWRRYLKEVQWYVMGTKPSLRRYLASRLVSKLTGSARLLAMTWNLQEFDGPSGVKILLSKLSQSPLVRKSVPNAASIMGQYFAFRRNPGEAISSFLIREALHYEEFRECLVRLSEEKQGISPEAHGFGLPSLDEESSDTEDLPEEQESGGKSSQKASREGASPGISTRRGLYERIPQRDPHERAQPPGLHQPDPGDAMLSVADSFILGQLRGWRLLTSASLTSNEWRDVLGTTQGKLDYESISNALQVLYDEQMSMATRQPTSLPHGVHNMVQAFSLDDDWGEDYGWTTSSSSSSMVDWDQSYYHDWQDDSWDDPWWTFYGEEQGADDQGEQEQPGDTGAQEEPSREASAEHMVLGWNQAQKGVAAMKKDRGFGRATCYICGSSQHLSAECPDKHAPWSKGKGKGKPRFMTKGANYVQDYTFDDWNAYAFIPKGKGKGKSKDVNYMKGKKGSGFPQKGKGKVNTYVLNHYGMEFEQEIEPPVSSLAFAATQEKQEKGLAMLDSGATCSAGPEASVQRLIHSILAMDSGAQVEVDTKVRPRFRYGSGKWNQALYRVVIRSQLSGEPRSFSCFSLPDPDELKEPWFKASMLVPVLLGMDFLQEVGAIVDFSDGSCCFARNAGAVMKLPMNTKGHFMLDIPRYLTNGKIDISNHVQVHVHMSDDSVCPHTLQNGLEMYGFFPLEVEWPSSSELMTFQRDFSSSSNSHFDMMMKRRFSLDQQLGLMGSLSSHLISSSSTSPSTLKSHADQEGDDRVGLLSSSDRGSERSKMQQLAVQRSACGRKEGSKQLGKLATLSTMWSPPELHPSQGSSSRQHQESKSNNGEESIAGTSRRAAQGHGTLGGTREGDAGKGDCRGKNVHFARGVQDCLGKEQQEDHQGQGGFGISKDFNPRLCSSAFSTKLSGMGEGVALQPGVREPSAVPQHGRDGESSCLGCSTCPRSEQRQSDQRHGVGAGLHPAMIEEKIGKMPLRVGRGLLNMALKLNDKIHESMSNLIYNKEPVVWELFCSPESTLSQEVLKSGVRAVRINLAGGFDLYKAGTYDQLRSLWWTQRPKKIWISSPCKFYCDWSDLNYYDRREVLEARRRREKQMHKKVFDYLLWILEHDPNVEIYWEWPLRCRAWKATHMEQFMQRLQRLGCDLFYCRIDGCRYGMKSQKGNFIQKSWCVMTTDFQFHQRFRLKTCLRNHEHEWLHGTETSRSAYYPVAMCRAIADFWKKQFFPERWLRMLWTAPVPLDPFSEMIEAPQIAHVEGSPDEELGEAPELPQLPDGEEEPDLMPESEPQPSGEEIKQWEIKLAKFHKSAGHPTARNMARMLSDAKLPRWKIKMALKHKCPVCEELKPGGSSSKQISPISVRQLPEPFQHIGIDVGDWECPSFGNKFKVKFALMIDIATKYRVVEPLFRAEHGTIKVENADDMIRTFTTRWLVDKPKPLVVIPDNAKSLTAQKFCDFLADLQIEVNFPPDHESWAHGIVERAIQQVKETASLIAQSLPDLEPELCLAMASSACNGTEYVKGFSSLQWVFGRQAEITDEELRQQVSLPLERQQNQFVRLMNNRQLAEDCARQARARLVISKLKNTSLRQPMRTFDLAQPVMLWRKFLPHTAHKGRRGGYKKTIKPRWVGPGRVVLHELIPGQREEDRRGIVWVVMGKTLYRCSVHSVRPLSSREQAIQDTLGSEDVSKWKQLSDLIPTREYVDVEHEEPAEGELESPDLLLPDVPPATSTIQQPRVRFTMKSDMKPDGYPSYMPNMPNIPVNEYVPDDDKPFEEHEDQNTGPSLPASSSLRRSSTSSSQPLIEKRSSEVIDLEEEPADSPGYLPTTPEEDLEEEPAAGPREEHPEAPDSKRARLDSDADDALHSQYIKMQQIMEEIEECYVMNIEVDFTSNRQKKAFKRDPTAFLVKKMANSEVSYKKLSGEEKKLFDRAMQKEVTSFLKTEAVRRCMDWEEHQEARRTGRVLQSRWVLVWKGVPDESRQEALQDLKDNIETTYASDATRKAKARIVVLGFQHPDLLNPEVSTTAPVQSQITRNLSLAITAQRKWTLEGLDMATAFLQTGKTEESRKIWMEGVPELKRALNAEDWEVLRILKNIYGNATAPRGLWEDVDQTFQALGGKRLLGDNSFWTWTKPNPNPRNDADRHILIGFIGGHVDDFNRAGDLQDPLWLEIRSKIDQAYKWGTTKVNNYRHTGLDLQVRSEGGQHYITVDQDFYVDGIPDLNIEPHRLRLADETKLTSAEHSACRAGLGGLQWIATQTQLQICARVNLLLSDLTVKNDLATAYDIQLLIKEVKQNPTTLYFWHDPTIGHWQDATIITCADQAHANRPKGDSTGGLITLIGGPCHREGKPGKLSIIGWRTWRLKRKAISTNDGEIQAMLEGEDNNYRTRLLWCEMNGCSGLPRVDLLNRANDLVRNVTGINATDSKGGFDAIKKNESPLLGLSNARSALQGYQLKEQLQDAGDKLIWLSGDWNLADAMTKKAKSARQGLEQFLKNYVWQLHYDPNFVVSERKARQQGRHATKRMQELQSLVPLPFWHAW